MKFRVTLTATYFVIFAIIEKKQNRVMNLAA